MKSVLRWLLYLVGWFIVTTGDFILSEKFKDNNLILYPSVFILLLLVVVVLPAVIYLMPVIQNKDLVKWQGLIEFFIFIGCIILLRVIALTCAKAGIV